MMNKYDNLSQSEKVKFSKCANKILNCIFLTRRKEEDKDVYYFIQRKIGLFKEFFAMIDYEIYYQENDQVIYIKNKDNQNSLNESILLLLFRLFYVEKKSELSLMEQVHITLGELHSRIISLGFEKRFTQTELREILSLYRKYHLVELIDKDYADDSTRICIYPTIIYAVRVNDVTNLYNSLKEYGGEIDD